LGVRQYKKDHLKALAPSLAVVPTGGAELRSEPEDPLRFWTRHEYPTYVDLTRFAEGTAAVASEGAAQARVRPFTGRPNLIAELAPALRVMLEYAAPRTVGQHLQALRDWWRLFDTVERAAVAKDGATVQSVADVGELHRQRAFDDNMDRGSFGAGIAVINIVRKTKGLRKLAWKPPARETGVRHLPPEWQIRLVRSALRHGWFAALDRWETADELLAGRPPQSEEEHRLLKNYERLRSAIERTGLPRPSGEDIRDGMPKTSFARQGFSIDDMLRGRYPDAVDIRYAFHLCLATTGWNPAVLLSLKADSAFLVPHPKDPTRYLLRGYKARGKSEQQTEGLYKSQGSAGVILQTLLRRSEPLRAQLRRELVEQEAALQTLLNEGAPAAELDRLRKRVAHLRDGVSSLWLYVVAKKTAPIAWLDPHSTTYTRASERESRKTFLDIVVAAINRTQPADRQVASLVPSDFRDAFAAYAYQLSGGMVLYVMKALGHKNLRSTVTYLDNTLINSKSSQLYRTFSEALWTEIKVHKRLDPTLVAKISRDGAVSDEQRQRLEDYRGLRRSRIGVGCKDPLHPPAHIIPGFKADGKAMCHVHRCMLCVEHAVIFPDSLHGLAKRLAELRAIRSRMSTVAFLESSFGEELENTELALRAFDTTQVAEEVRDWEARIRNGLHRVVDHDGLEGHIA